MKEVIIRVTGERPYGSLKFEGGVHRVQRVPVTESQGRIHTSTATVAVLPEIPEAEFEIKQEDLRIDIYRSGGHGGQGVNTTDSAVRITHLPTGIVVAIQNERSQHANKDTAMELLKGKLVQMKLEQQAESLGELRAGESAKWGQQIRNYVLQPYKLVKDTRTKYEETDADAVLDGKIQGFIDAFLEDTIGKE
jgi:peptide chain release factor 2